MTAKRVETADFDAFVRRVLKAYGRRIGESGDIDALVAIQRLRVEAREATYRAVHSLRENYGYSWTDIGRELGISRQAAQQRFSRPLSGS